MLDLMISKSFKMPINLCKSTLKT